MLYQIKSKSVYWFTYERDYTNSYPLHRKRNFEKDKVNCRVDFAPVLQLIFSFVELTHFCD